MNEGKDFWLTTSDNPFNFFKDFDNWYRYDIDHGYYTCGLVARLANTSDYLTDEMNDVIVDEAIESFLKVAIPFINDDGIEVKYMKSFEED